MLVIELEPLEYYDDSINEFVYVDGGTVRFEYSLKAVYDWEAKWRRPFLKGDPTDEELVDFFLTMAIDPMDERFMTVEVMEELSQYIEDTPTATTFSKGDNNQNGDNNHIGKSYTAEEIYGLMFMHQIPIILEERNLNRLLVILKIIGNYNQPKEKMSQGDIYAQNRKLNEERRLQYQTKG